MLSIVMPARDEEGSIVETIAEIAARLQGERIAYEIIVVDDGSRDGTRECVLSLGSADAGIRLVDNEVRHGFGMAIRAGLPHCTGDAVVIMMADGSDSPADLVTYYRKFEAGHSCVFGSRFMRGGKVVGYPVHKRLINRLANWFIKVLFGLRYNDITNAFKCYSREAIEHMQPLISPHFNLTVEMPLKAIVRGFSYTVSVARENPVTRRLREGGSAGSRSGSCREGRRGPCMKASWSRAVRDLSARRSRLRLRTGVRRRTSSHSTTCAGAVPS
jgi:dolichol-phosphate mannosyltransferase